MPAPAKPTVPATPTRAEPSTFSERSERMVDFFFALLGYIAEANDFTDEQAQLALTAGMAKHPCRPRPELTCRAGSWRQSGRHWHHRVAPPNGTGNRQPQRRQEQARTIPDVLTPLRTAQVIERLRVSIGGTTYNIVST